MRRIRIFALGIVSFFAVLMGALLAPGTFVNRALSAALCTVFSFSSTVCTVNLAKSSDRVVAATPLAVERNISDWLVQRAPGEFDDAPSAPPGSNPQAPPFPQDPGPNIIRPEFDDPGSRIDPSLVRPSPLPPDVNRAIDSATKNATGEALGLITEKCDFSSVGTSLDDQKCFEASGNQCLGGLPDIRNDLNPQYNNDTCKVRAFVSPGSTAHDSCCIADPNGYACRGWGATEAWDAARNPNTYIPNKDSSTISDPGDAPCEADWRQAKDDVWDRRGEWKEYGPYYSLTGTWISRGSNYTGDDKGCSAGYSGTVTVDGQDTAPGHEFTMTQKGNQIISPPQNVSYSSGSDSGSYTQSGSGTVSLQQVTITSSGGGFTTQCKGTIINDRNTVTGQCSCQFSGGSATATGSFTWTRKK
jgi:hypothetical protein